MNNYRERFSSLLQTQYQDRRNAILGSENSQLLLVATGVRLLAKKSDGPLSASEASALAGLVAHFDWLSAMISTLQSGVLAVNQAADEPAADAVFQSVVWPDRSAF